MSTQTNSSTHVKSSSQLIKTQGNPPTEDPNYVSESKSLGKTLSNKNKVKKEVIMNAQLLANRIALLQHEEAKMISKINETRKKTYDLYKIKKNNEDWKNLKKKTRNHDDLKIIETQTCSQKYREQHEELRKKIRDALLIQKQQEAEDLRKERKRNEQRIKEQSEGSTIENQRASTRVKASLFQGRLKIKEYSNNRSQIFKQDKTERMLHDDLLVKRKELEIAKMELQEMELIKKLQNTHEVQKSIYEEYDSLLNESIQDFEKKFQPPENKKYGGSLEKSPKRTLIERNKAKIKSKLVKTPQALLPLKKTKEESEKATKIENRPEESPEKENLNKSP